MQRRSIPAILEEIGALLEIEGENPFKVKAYYNAAKILAGVEDLDAVISEGRLREIRGIGQALSAKIVECHETGRIAYHEDLKLRVPRRSSSFSRYRTSVPARSSSFTTSWA
jgi:DNA polymerase (family 10)